MIPTSNTYNFNMTYFQVISKGAQKAGYQQSTLEPDDYHNAFDQINLIYSQWVTEYNLFSCMEFISIPLGQGQIQVIMPSQCIQVVGRAVTVLRQQEEGASDLIMERISTSQYQQIVNKTQQGCPHQYQVVRTSSQVYLNIWCTSDTTTDVLNIWYYSQPGSNLGNQGQAPTTWYWDNTNPLQYWDEPGLFWDTDFGTGNISINDLSVISPRWLRPLINEIATWFCQYKGGDLKTIMKLRKETDASILAAASGEADIAGLNTQFARRRSSY